MSACHPTVKQKRNYNVSDQEQANSTGRRVLHKPVWADTLLAALRFEISRSNVNVHFWHKVDILAALSNVRFRG
jgi:hypothetical protein